MEQSRLQDGLQAVSEAEKALIKAQSYNSPQTYQEAHNELMHAMQLMNELMSSSNYTTDETAKLKLANEHLHNLVRTNDAIQ